MSLDFPDTFFSGASGLVGSIDGFPLTRATIVAGAGCVAFRFAAAFTFAAILAMTFGCRGRLGRRRGGGFGALGVGYATQCKCGYQGAHDSFVLFHLDSFFVVNNTPPGVKILYQTGNLSKLSAGHS